jgi:hypothetical protein
MPNWRNFFGLSSKLEPGRPSVSEYPKTFESIAGPENAGRPKVFEPALLHFRNAYRLGDPQFADPVVKAKWYAARLRVVDHILNLLSNSRWREHLVLRGSLLLKAWLGDKARPPRDIDWVFKPVQVGLNDELSKDFFIDLVKALAANPHAGGAVIDADNAAVDDIWTYERAAGRRIILPWKMEQLPPGEVQMDVVFGEHLFTAPTLSAIPSSLGGINTLWTASREESLAWKLLWLETDIHPQGKDLYDATLLAEQTQLPRALLHQVLNAADWRVAEKITPDFTMKWVVDWDNFKLEYPWVEGDLVDWQQRLTTALQPTFESNS